MDNILINYLADKLLIDLKNNKNLDPALLKSADSYLIIDFLRSKIRKNDIGWLLNVVKSTNCNTGNFAISLLRHHINDAAVKAFLFQEWETVSDYDRRYAIMWRLLDYDDLPISMHEKIYDYFIENKERFLSEKMEWFGGVEKVLDVCRERLSDSGISESKKWIYLCASIVSPNKEGVINLLSEYKVSDDMFTAKVANQLLKNVIQ
jgi:hypothetical protein